MGGVWLWVWVVVWVWEVVWVWVWIIYRSLSQSTNTTYKALSPRFDTMHCHHTFSTCTENTLS